MVGIARYVGRRGGLLLHTGRDRLDDVGARYRAERLLRELGLAVYAHHHGGGQPEAVTAALARLGAQLRDHPVDLDIGGLRGYLSAASGADHDRATDKPTA